ncbi:uncharacterized protein F54H12.2-like, partial [Sceloporus undulatus]|uniref:uncharacterized protein F54H12.2-like n=1 Tax=Sceloporus undulatus TaxID=8520 RepID=UPI001C4BA5D3
MAVWQTKVQKRQTVKKKAALKKEASLFSQLDVVLGNRLITLSNNCYPYRAMMELILNYSGDTLSTQFMAELMDQTLLTDAGNSGFRARAAQTAGSCKWDLMAPLHSDLFFQDKMLLNGVDVKIKFTRSKDKFCLMSGALVDNYKVHILNAALFVKRVKVSPAVRLGNAEALLTANAKYPIEHVRMKVFSIPGGSLICNQENLFLGQLPKQLVIGFVNSAAFSGDYSQNSFNFKHFNVNFVALYVDEVQVPSKPLQPNYLLGQCVREFMQLVQVTGKEMKDQSLLINRNEFSKGYTLYGFDLSLGQSCADHYSLIKTGNLRAEIR